MEKGLAVALLLVDSWDVIDRIDGADFLEENEGCFECRRRCVLVVEGMMESMLVNGDAQYSPVAKLLIIRGLASRWLFNRYLYSS